MNINIGPPGLMTGAPSLPVNSGFSLSKLKHDGSPAQLVRVAGNSVFFHTLVYDRWAETKNLALHYLERVVTGIAVQPTNPVTSFLLRYIDRFPFDGSVSEVQASLLFREHTKFLAGVCLDIGPFWHCNTGWFEPSSHADRLLHQLNVSIGAVGDVATATIDHTATQTLTPRSTIDDIFRPKGALDLETALDRMHKANKVIVADLVVPAIAQKIGLHA